MRAPKREQLTLDADGPLSERRRNDAIKPSRLRGQAFVLRTHRRPTADRHAHPRFTHTSWSVVCAVSQSVSHTRALASAPTQEQRQKSGNAFARLPCQQNRVVASGIVVDVTSWPIRV